MYYATALAAAVFLDYRIDQMDVIHTTIDQMRLVVHHFQKTLGIAASAFESKPCCLCSHLCPQLWSQWRLTFPFGSSKYTREQDVGKRLWTVTETFTRLLDAKSIALAVDKRRPRPAKWVQNALVPADTKASKVIPNEVRRKGKNETEPLMGGTILGEGFICFRPRFAPRGSRNHRRFILEKRL
jgi:hypothetical protein